MSISDGTVTLTNGSKIITFTNGKIFDKGVKAGAWFNVTGEEVFYHFEVPPTDNITGKLLETYGGVNQANVTYQILTDFNALGQARLSSTTKDAFAVISENDKILADILAQAGITGTTNYRKLPRVYLGMPEQDRTFGAYKLGSSHEIAELTVYAEAPPLVNIGLDMAINGVYQSTGLVLSAGQYSNPVTVAINGISGDIVNFKFTSVPGSDFPGQNYTVDVKYKDTSSMEIRYDFNRLSPGMAAAGKRIGRGYKPPVKSRIFGGMITAQGAPLGADLKIALMHQDIQKTQELKLTAGSTSEYTSFAQLDCLTTETLDTIITQPGSDFPGDNITVILYSYKIT